MAKKKLLGLYDSGVGGLTVLQEIRKIYPGLSFHYLADNSSLPLGDKPLKEIQEKVRVGMDYLFSKDCSLVLLVCNTASITSARFLQQQKLFDPKEKNLLGVSWPLIEAMVADHSDLKNKKGLILSTKATHESGFYQEELKKAGFQDVISLAVPGLSIGIEKKSTELIREELEKMKGSLGKAIDSFDYVILACTHFPLATPELKKYFKSGTVFIDPAPAVAVKLKEYLEKHPEYEVDTTNAHSFFSTT